VGELRNGQNTAVVVGKVEFFKNGERGKVTEIHGLVLVWFVVKLRLFGWHISTYLYLFPFT
jgi:hypothetical protein